MTDSDQQRRFFNTTRGKIVALLCTAQRTVSELAAQLGLTDNAVRAQLALLERDGLARQSGLRAGTRKPNFAYDLTAQGHRLFPKLEGPLLAELLSLLSEAMGKRKLHSLLVRTGARILSQKTNVLNQSTTAQRLQALAEGLLSLGIPLQVESEGKDTIVRGCSCPLAAAVADHTDLCDAAADLLTETLGCPVTQMCQYKDHPRCCFKISPTPQPS